MRFPKKKTYGVYKTVTCPFCSRMATQKNEQGIEVCYQHIKSAVEEIKCTCGSWLEPKAGKFGRYFNCMNCGNMNYEKAMQIKEITAKKGIDTEKKETTVKKEVISTPKREIISFFTVVSFFSVSIPFFAVISLICIAFS